jgi:hypothetical protein
MSAPGLLPASTHDGIARDVWLEAAAKGFIISVVFVPREDNTTADALSRLATPLNDAAMSPGWVNKVVKAMGGPEPTMDVFASRDSAQLPRFLSWRGRSSTGGTSDALAAPWDSVVWVFPPVAIGLLALTRFIEQEQCRVAFFVTPDWNASPVKSSIEAATRLRWRRMSLPKMAVSMESSDMCRERQAVWCCYWLSKTSRDR